MPVLDFERVIMFIDVESELDFLHLLSLLVLLLVLHLFLLLIAEFSEVHDLAHRRLAGFSNNDEVKRCVFRSLTCLIEFQNTQLFAIRADHA